MKRLHFLVCIALAMSIVNPVFAQAQMGSGSTGGMNMKTDTPMTDGEVRKIDKELGKLTIKHGPIMNLDMAAMTMVFNVKDKSFLDKVKVGDKIRFVVIMEGSKMVVTEIRPAP